MTPEREAHIRRTVRDFIALMGRSDDSDPATACADLLDALDAERLWRKAVTESLYQGPCPEPVTVQDACNFVDATVANIERLARARDEARAEVDRLREVIRGTLDGASNSDARMAWAKDCLLRGFVPSKSLDKIRAELKRKEADEEAAYLAARKAERERDLAQAAARRHVEREVVEATRAERAEADRDEARHIAYEASVALAAVWKAADDYGAGRSDADDLCRVLASTAKAAADCLARHRGGAQP